MRVGELESVLLFVSDLDTAKKFYVDLLGLPTIFENGASWSRLRTTISHFPAAGRSRVTVFMVSVISSGGDDGAWAFFPVRLRTQISGAF